MQLRSPVLILSLLACGGKDPGPSGDTASSPGLDADPAAEWSGVLRASGLGDIDSDGFDDLFLGPHTRDATGQVWLGASGGPTAGAAASVDNGPAGGVGDVDCDGTGDLLAQVADQTTLFYGAAFSRQTALSSDLLNFPDSVGDLDGDGCSEVVAFDAAGVHVHRGTPEGPSGDADWLLEGSALSGNEHPPGAGDFNGDGYVDLAIAPEGEILIYVGSPTGPVSPYSVSTAAEASRWTAGLRDLNRDGFDDLAAFDNDYLIQIFHGSAVGLAAEPASEVILDFPACAVAGAGDVDADGYGDVVVGDCRSVSLYRGSEDGLPEVPSQTVTRADSCCFGYTVDAAGDVNGDGHDDILAGDGDVAVLILGR